MKYVCISYSKWFIADAASSRFSIAKKSGEFHLNVNLDNATPATNDCHSRTNTKRKGRRRKEEG